MKKNDEKYTWYKDKIESYPTISFSKYLVGFFRLTVFLSVTFFFVFIFLIFKVFFKQLELYKPIFFIRKIWSILILKLFGLKLEVVGKQFTNSKIFVCNHISWTDILVIQSAIDIIFVAKSDVKKMPGLGFLASIANTIFIDRNPQKIAEDSHLIKKIIKKGAFICFFPEGTSTDGLRVLKFKSGFFQLLFDKNLNIKNELSTVQPLSIYYQVNNKKLSNDFYGWWGSMSIISHIIKILCLSSGSVILRFHKPFDSKDFSNRKELAIAVESIISKDISNQILNN